MTVPIDVLALFLHLARASGQRRRPHVRDRLLILAGVVAARMEMHSIADYCRHLVLESNPHHLVRQWPSFAKALNDPDFAHFLKHLQRRYPLEKAERMLVTLGIEMDRERDAYYSDEEYAAALLGTNPEALRTRLE